MQKVRNTRVMDMTEGSAAKLLFAFALPIFLGNLFQQFYNLADTAIAGHLLGDGALAQIGATAALYSTITGFAFGLNTGFALVVSRFFGAGDEWGVRRASGWMVVLAAIWAVVLTGGFLVLRHPLLSALNTPDTVMEGALSYITVILAGIPLTMAYNLEAGLLRSVGNSMTPLYFLMFSCGLNVGLDYLFMGPLGMGVRGAAAATVISQGISAAMGFVYIVRNYAQMRFRLEDLKAAPELSGEMFVTGLSMAMMSTIYSIGSVILQSSINALGSVYIAAQVGGRRLVELFMMPGGALSSSCATFASQNFGAGKWKRMDKVLMDCIFLSVTVAVLLGGSAYLFGPELLKIYTNNPQVIQCGVEILLYTTVTYFLCGLMDLFPGALRGMGCSTVPMILSVIGTVGTRIIWIFWVFPKHRSLDMLFISYPASWIVSIVMQVVCFWFVRKKVHKTLQEHHKISA